MSLEQFDTRRGAHLARYHTLEIFLDVDDVDGSNLVGFHHELQLSVEHLRLLAFPVEVNADGHVVERERGILGVETEGEFAILIATPKNTSLGELHRLFALKGLALGGVWGIEEEGYLLSAHYSHLHHRFFLVFGIAAGS